MNEHVRKAVSRPCQSLIVQLGAELQSENWPTLTNDQVELRIGNLEEALRDAHTVVTENSREHRDELANAEAAIEQLEGWVRAGDARYAKNRSVIDELHANLNEHRAEIEDLQRSLRGKDAELFTAKDRIGVLVGRLDMFKPGPGLVGAVGETDGVMVWRWAE